MDILFVSTADWDNPYWTNKQHVAVELGRRGHNLLYVESQGLRAPTATVRDFKRIFRRLCKGLIPPRKVCEGVWVWSPIVIPFQGNSTVRRINRLVLRLSIMIMCMITRIKPEILWTYSPMTTEFYNIDSYKKLVYHAVDDIKEQPGMPAQVIAKAEKILSKRADIIFTTAPHLQDTHSRINPNTHFFPNVADFDHFHKALDPATPIPEDMSKIPAPRIGFVGAISGYKVDFDLLAAIAKAKPDWSIVMIGEVGEGDPYTDISKLRQFDNIHFLGGKSYSMLPAYLKGMDVAILPSLLNDYTRSMFPMKFFEYLAAGRPVVATELPALSSYRNVAALCAGEQSFIESVAEALAGRACNPDQRLAAAREQTYKSRTDKMLALLGMADIKPEDGN